MAKIILQLHCKSNYRVTEFICIELLLNLSSKLEKSLVMPEFQLWVQNQSPIQGDYQAFLTFFGIFWKNLWYNYFYLSSDFDLSIVRMTRMWLLCILTICVMCHTREDKIEPFHSEQGESFHNWISKNREKFRQPPYFVQILSGQFFMGTSMARVGFMVKADYFASITWMP